MSDKTDKPSERLEHESSVTRAYGELKKMQPPARLDERILAEARRAAATEDTTVVRVHRWRRWTMPAALAATVVFAVPLVVRVFETTAPEPGSAVAPAAIEADAADLAGPLPLELAPQDLVEQVERRGQTITTERKISAPPATPPDMDRPALQGSAPATAEVAVMQPDSAPMLEAAAEEMRDKSRSQLRQETIAALPGRDEAAAGFAAAPEREPGLERAAGAPAATMTAGTPGDVRENVVVTGSRVYAPEYRLIEIARLHESGRLRTARRELGLFLTDHPDYELPEFFPLQEKDAIFPEVIPAAEEWLRDIARLVERGENDRARMQLAEFFEHYPDYRLPDDFPLRPEDAVIER